MPRQSPVRYSFLEVLFTAILTGCAGIFVGLTLAPTCPPCPPPSASKVDPASYACRSAERYVHQHCRKG